MSKILPVSRLTHRLTEKEKKELIPYPEDSPTPSQMTDEDCCYPSAPRPCPLVSCRYNNYLTVTENGTILLTWEDLQPEEVPPEDSCALDVSRRGHSANNPMPFGDLRHFIGSSSRENARIVVESAQAHARRLRNIMQRKKIDDENA